MIMRVLGVSLMLLAVGTFSAVGQDATIKIDIERTIGAIDPMIYGGFIEHMGRCIYGGIYDPGNPLSDEDGFRKDTLQAVRDLQMPVIRWPGGNFSSGYHWMDGIGPREKRPARVELAWGSVESNAIGTDEYLAWCRKVGTEPYICVNLGTGSWEEARAWVEYCNRPKGTQYADLRVQNGHEEPYGVKYWGLGNEIDGPWQMGYKNAADYSKFALEAAKLMKWMDNKIQLIASGSSNFGADWMEWNRTVLETLRDQIDFISLHTYVGSSGDYYEFMAQPVNVDRRIERTAALIEETRLRHNLQKPIYIAFDEYNVWHRANKQYEVPYVFEDALVVAGFLNSFVRHADSVKMANMAQVVNVLAPIHVEERGLYLHTIYYALQLFAQHCHGNALDIFVKSPTFDAAGFKAVPYLDVSAAYHRAKKQLIIAAVNRHPEQALSARILNQTGGLKDQAKVYELFHEDLKAANSFDGAPVQPVEKTTSCQADGLTYTFPPHSFTVIVAEVEE